MGRGSSPEPLDSTSASSVWRAQSSHRLKHAGMTDFGERRFTQPSELRESTQRDSKMQSEIPKVARTHREIETPFVQL